jgi:hypothetical protein
MRLTSLLLAAALAFVPVPLLAGMGFLPSSSEAVATTYRQLAESAELRMQVISFFVLVLLVCPLGAGWLWNSLRRDFPRMPRIGYFRSLGLVALWGLLFLVVLTMIAATRELMTPGSWQKQGLLYQLTATPPAAPNHAPKPAEKKP